MPPRPAIRHQPTSNTLAPEDQSELGGEGSSDTEPKTTSKPLPGEGGEDTSGTEAKATSAPSPEGGNIPDTEANHSTPVPGGKGSSGPDAGEKAPPLVSNFIDDAILLAALLVMLAWPWIFLGVVWGRKGVEMNDHVAKVITDHPHGTSFFVTLLGNIVNLIVSIIFSFSIIRFAQEMVTSGNDVTVFHVSLLSALRHQSWPWGFQDLGYLFDRTRWLAAALVGGCIAAFAFVPGSTTSLINPAPFNRTSLLTGTELNFSSNAADCLAWFEANRIPNNCDWKVFNNLQYTSCLGENQMVDVLESGRGNILSLLSNNSETLVLSQLGAKGGMHFLGPIRGVLPLGPNGVPAFNTLKPSAFDTNAARMISYNYTLDHQGFASNISCKYDSQSPIRYTAVANNTRLVAYNATCDGLADVLTDVVDFPTLNVNNTLTFWACKSIPTGKEEPTYYVYLRGRLNYATAIGNITCALSPMQPAVFPVMYQSKPGIFSSKEPTAIFANTFPELIERALVALGGIIWEAQNVQANLVAESVITFGVKAFRLPPYEPSEQYLRLYEAMIQGIVEYETTYARLIYSTIASPPDSCIRTVTGSLSYMVIGWSVDYESIGFLIPMTIVNLASLVVLLIAMFHAKKSGYKFDPLKPHALLAAVHTTEEGEPISIEWGHTVKYRTEVLKSEASKLGEQQLGQLKGPLSDVVAGGLNAG